MTAKKHKLGLSQRRERACVLFARGYTNVDVKKDLGVSNDAVAGYRQFYDERLHAQAAANPDFLADVLANTIRMLTETEQVRADAWKALEDRKTMVECPECETTFKVTLPVTDDIRAKHHNTILKALDSRAKLFGILGIKAEAFAQIQGSLIVQGKLIEWMMTNLQPADRDALATFMETELSEYVGTAMLEIPEHATSEV